MFRMIKEGIVEMIEEHFQTFQVKMFVGKHGARTLMFKDCWGCGAPEFFGVKDPNIARRRIANMECAQMTRFYPEGSKVRFVAGFLRE